MRPARSTTLAAPVAMASSSSPARSCPCTRRQSRLQAAASSGRAGRITGYATPVAFFGHAVGETNEDLQALIGAAEAFGGPGFLVPTRNGELLRWCLGRGLRVAQTMTLMSMGLYNEPAGAWLPSILY